MWIFTRYGFFSIAAAKADGGQSHTPDPDKVMVRARQKRHLQNLQKRFPQLADVEILSGKSTDYRYRIIIPKSVWSECVNEFVNEQDWSNFKGETERFLGPGFRDYTRALHRVWNVMHELQETPESES